MFRFPSAARFNLKSKEGLADRKVPAQPLVYYNKEGKITRYNLRKVSCPQLHASARKHVLGRIYLFIYLFFC